MWSVILPSHSPHIDIPGHTHNPYGYGGSRREVFSSTESRVPRTISGKKSRQLVRYSGQASALSRVHEEWLLNREVPYNEVEESKLRTTPGPAWECFPMSHFALLWTTSRNEGLSAISRASSARRQSAKSRVRRVM